MHLTVARSHVDDLVIGPTDKTAVEAIVNGLKAKFLVSKQI